jgi:hypothetical protein
MTDKVYVTRDSDGAGLGLIAGLLAERGRGGRAFGNRLAIGA